MRLFILLTGLALAVLLPFIWWGNEAMDPVWTARMQEWLTGPGRAWGGAAGMGLLAADVVLPVPATAVIGALGYAYGVWAGGLLGAGGSFLSGWLAYGLCRRFGRGAADRLLGPQDQARAARLFSGRPGGWLVALSRWLPLLPEMTACLAGLTGMAPWRFFPALACGCLPMGFAFAAVGASGQDRPGLALALSAALPAVLYLAALIFLKRREQH